MARSHAVWLLIEEIEVHTEETSYTTWLWPIAAFTVKHELISYLNECQDKWNRLRLFRMKDGPHPRADFREQYQEPTVTEIGIEEVMK